MTQSAVQFIPANSFRTGRVSTSVIPGAPLLNPPYPGSPNASGLAEIHNLVLHTAECSETKGSAIAVAKYFKLKSTKKVSTHFTSDQAGIIQCVKLADTAFHAGPINSRSIGIEICGRAAQSLVQWHDDFSSETLEHVAALCADLHALYNVPLIKLTAEDLLAGKRGLCGHADVSKACVLAKTRKLTDSIYNTSSNGHFDPGTSFPWDEFIEATQFYCLNALTAEPVRKAGVYS